MMRALWRARALPSTTQLFATEAMVPRCSRPKNCAKATPLVLDMSLPVTPRTVEKRRISQTSGWLGMHES